MNVDPDDTNSTSFRYFFIFLRVRKIFCVKSSTITYIIVQCEKKLEECSWVQWSFSYFLEISAE